MENKTLNLLILEDNPDDAELAVKELEREGFTVKWRRVETEKAFRKAFAEKPDLILADYSLPSYDGLAALQIRQGTVPEIPLIIVSGTIGENVAVECMKSGATDFVLKGNLSRLSTIVKRALKEAGAYRERWQAVEALRESEDKYRNIFENSVEGIYESTPEGRFVRVNPAFSKMLGYASPEELVSNISDIAKQYYVNPEDRRRFQQLLQKAGSVKNFEFKARCKDGSQIWVSNSTRAFFNEDSKVVRYEGIVKNISWRKKAEEELRESEEKLTQAIQGNSIPTYIIDNNHIVTHWNNACESLTGFPAAEMVGTKKQWLAFYPEERPVLADLILDGATKEEIEVYYEGKHHKSILIEGAYEGEGFYPYLGEKGKWLFFTAAPLRDQSKNIIGAIQTFQDITERRNTEEQLRQAQKMEAVGTLAGGIAHEFNNILTTIIGNTELAVGAIPERNPARECLDQIQSSSLRAKDVVRQLLGFARKSVFQLQPVHLSLVIKEAMILIRASTPASIEIRQNFSCEPDTVMADSSQINLLLISLCANARNAMQKEGGVLEVKLENTTIDEKSAAGYEDLGPGNYVKITIGDTGNGIDPKIVDRIFEPYFTTRSLAEATGMGLAVVHGIVKRHNGAIIVESEPEKGTVFEVLFPLTEAESEQEAGGQEALPTGNEKILFVDDEEFLVKLGQKMLNKLGYSVETKRNPVEALELVRSEPDRFDLVITDMSMPKMTGDKLAKEILNIRPDMPIILCTGFSEKIDAEKAKELGIRKYIEKPLGMFDFVVAVRKVLDQGIE